MSEVEKDAFELDVSGFMRRLRVVFCQFQGLKAEARAHVLLMDALRSGNVSGTEMDLLFGMMEKYLPSFERGYYDVWLEIQSYIQEALKEHQNRKSTSWFDCTVGDSCVGDAWMESECLFAWKNLVTADLRKANLVEADLRDARMRGALLTGANLCGACLTGADTTEADFTGAKYNGRTQFPEGFCPEREGMIHSGKRF